MKKHLALALLAIFILPASLQATGATPNPTPTVSAAAAKAPAAAAKAAAAKSKWNRYPSQLYGKFGKSLVCETIKNNKLKSAAVVAALALIASAVYYRDALFGSSEQEEA